MANAVDVNEADQRKKQARKALKAWKKNQKTNLFELKDENNKSTTIKLAGKVPLPRVCDPVISQLNPSVYLGAVSPQFDDEAAEYVEKYDKYAERNRPSCKDALRALLNVKYMRTLAQPGEAVGVIAGQSVGEPSTQMTLNTFHLAGKGEANVTLGIPRLREILMTGNTKLPTMTIPLAPNTSRADVVKVANTLYHLSLEELVGSIVVKESLAVDRGAAIMRQYEIGKFMQYESLILAI